MPEVLARWYTRRESLAENGAPLADAVCYCRQETDEDTVIRVVLYCNPSCAIL